MKKIILGSLLICSMLCNLAEAQQINHSDIRISLLTSDPGEDIYAVFGHSAIRVKIDAWGYDVVYNYGTFNFNQPNFVANFARGKMLYHLSMNSYESFVFSYMYENRGIREQVFELDSAQTVFMVRFLENNYQAENRYYLYHFFLDNCATRIRDLIEEVFEGITFPEAYEAPSYRDLIHRYLTQHPWGRFGIDIALGLPTDKKTDIYEQMFLPDFLFDAFANVRYNGRSIVSETKTIFIPDPENPAILPPGPIKPVLVCSLVLALAVLLLFVRKGSRIFDFSLFFVAGLTGILVIFLWFFTEHTFTQNNLNIIWALPTHTVIAFFMLSKRNSGWLRKYFLATAVIAMLLLFAWVFLPQRLNPALIPLVLAIALRAYRNSRLISV